MTPEELVEELSARILGPGRLTSEEVVAHSGATLEQATELWVSLGFPPVDPEQATFTEADARHLANVAAYHLLGFATPEVTVPMARVLGQALSRVAAAQASAFSEPLLALLEDPAAARATEAGPTSLDLDAITELLVPGFESFVSYAWRRHLVAAIRRDLLGHDAAARVVGFGDLVGFTRQTRDLGDDALSDLLGRFQRVATEQVTASGAQIVKGLGDGVMFTAATPEVAAAAALGLVAACEDDDVLPSVRVGLAHGHVVELEGDLYGPTVNRASRLAEVAHPGTVLADVDAGELLDGDGALEVKRTREYHLKGLGKLRPFVVRRARD